MPEMYDNWDRLVGRVIRHMKDRDLCYQSSISTQTSSTSSSHSLSPSLCRLLALTVTADPVSPPDTAPPTPSVLKKVVLRVSLDDVRTMKGAFNLLIWNLGSGTHSIELDSSDGKLTVTGDLADPWVVAIKLRKLCNYVEIVSVRPARELMRPSPAQLVMV